MEHLSTSVLYMLRDKAIREEIKTKKNIDKHKEWLEAYKKANTMLEYTIKNTVAILVDDIEKGEKTPVYGYDIPLEEYNDLVQDKENYFEFDGNKFSLYDLHTSNFNKILDNDILRKRTPFGKQFNQFWTEEEEEENPFLKAKMDLAQDGFYLVDKNWLKGDPEVILCFEKPEEFDEYGYQDDDLIIYI